MAARRLAPALFDLTGRVAVVTGAAAGLGREICVGLADAGAAVVAGDVNADGLADTVSRITASGGRAIGVRCDVASAQDVDALFTATDSAFGRIDILVNDAVGPLHRDHPEAFPLEAWERTLDVNLTGYFLCARAAGRRMIDQGRGGSIVMMSSIAGTSALGRGNFAYSVSKGGIIQLARELAIEWAQHRIRVNAIQPCQFVTRGWAGMLADPSKQAWVDHAVRGIPLGRMGDPSEIVGPVLFLASDASSMVTGAVLPVDGGNLALNAGGSLSW